VGGEEMEKKLATRTRADRTRIQITVERAGLRRVRAYLDELGMNRGEISVFMRMAMEGLEVHLGALVAAKRSGKQLTLSDVFGQVGQLIGRQLEETQK
jgi:hypothetical protein